MKIIKLLFLPLTIFRRKKNKENEMEKTISVNGVEKLIKHEGLRLKAYKDSGGILTIGFGHTGADVTEGLEITKEKAKELLKKDLSTAIDFLNSLKLDLTQNQFDALVSFIYNVGTGAFKSSTLLKKIKSKDSSAPDEFLRWNKVKGKEIKGLTTRRSDERELFIS